MPPGGGTKATGLMQDGRTDEARGGNAERIVADRRQQYRTSCGKCGASRVDQQIGLEATPEEWVAALVGVFREVRRVLRADGTCWVEVGDSYNSSPSNQKGKAGSGMNERPKYADRGQDDQSERQIRRIPGLKTKDMIGAPWMLAKALRDPYYTGTIKDDGDRKWLAAIIDGEGSIQIHKRPAGTRSYSTYEKADGTVSDYKRLADSYQPKLEISNTNIALLERVIELTGEGKTTTKQLAGTFGRKQTLYRWSLTADKARALLREVYPHLVAKQHEARLAYSCPSSGDVAGEAHEALKALHQGGSSEVDLEPPETLFERGWFLRSDIVWSRRPQPNPMPESVTDRPTKSHSYVFLLAKQPKYFFDQEAVREPHADTEWTRRGAANGESVHAGAVRGAEDGLNTGRPTFAAGVREYNPAGRNVRSVWSIATEAYPDAHFATYPQELVRRCLLAGCPELVCADCGRPRTQVELGHESKTVPGVRGDVHEAEKESLLLADMRQSSNGSGAQDDSRLHHQREGLQALVPAEASDGEQARVRHGAPLPDGGASGASLDGGRGSASQEREAGGQPSGEPRSDAEADSRSAEEATSATDSMSSLRGSGSALSACPPTCSGRLAPGVVLDPFAGSGTAGLVARKHGRRSVLIELSADYCELVATRTRQLSLLSEAT